MGRSKRLQQEWLDRQLPQEGESCPECGQTVSESSDGLAIICFCGWERTIDDGIDERADEDEYLRMHEKFIARYGDYGL